MILTMMKIIFKLLFISDFWFDILNLKNVKHLEKISEELMPAAWRPKGWWNFCISEDQKKEIVPIFAE